MQQNLYNAQKDALLKTAIQGISKGEPNWVATLDGAWLVPSSELPSYVDDVLEFANLAAFPVTWETWKIYVAIDTWKTYRWSWSIYIQIAMWEFPVVDWVTITWAWTELDPFAATQQNSVLYNSAWCITNPTFTDNWTGNITVNTVDVLLHNDNDHSSIVQKYILSPITETLTDMVINYVIADYNWGSPILRITTDVSVINESNIIPVFTIVRTWTTLHPINWDQLWYWLNNKLHQSIVKTQRYRRETWLSLSEYWTRNIELSSWIMWIWAHSVSLSQIDTWTDWIRFYKHVAWVWTFDWSTTQYNNTQYDNWTDLVTLWAWRYAINWVYRWVETNKHLYITLWSWDYNLNQARSAQPPTPPVQISSHAVLVWKIIVLKSATTATSIESAFDVTFTFVAPQNHNDLTWLQWWTTNEYYHLSSAQHDIINSSTYNKTTAPTITNDITEWYVIWSEWIDTTNDKVYKCLDNTDWAAVWIEITNLTQQVWDWTTITWTWTELDPFVAVDQWWGWVEITKTFWENMSAWDVFRYWNINIAESWWKIEQTISDWWIQLNIPAYWQSVIISETLPLSQITTRILRSIMPDDWTLTCSIYSDQWITLIATSPDVLSFSTVWGWFSEWQMTFSFNTTLIAGTYYIKFIPSVVTTNNYISQWLDDAWYTWWKWYTIDWDWVWTELWRDLVFSFTAQVLETPEHIYKANATSSTKVNAVWFVSETKNKWEDWIVSFWYDWNQTWLTIGVDLFLSDTPWEVSELPWTIIKKIWSAISSTEAIFDLEEWQNQKVFQLWEDLSAWDIVKVINDWKIKKIFWNFTTSSSFISLVQSQFMEAVLLEDNKIFIAFSSNADGNYQWIVWIIDPDTKEITFWYSAVFCSDSSSYQPIKVTKVNSTKVAIAYCDATGFNAWTCIIWEIVWLSLFFWTPEVFWEVPTWVFWIESAWTDIIFISFIDNFIAWTITWTTIMFWMAQPWGWQIISVPWNRIMAISQSYSDSAHKITIIDTDWMWITLWDSILFSDYDSTISLWSLNASWILITALNQSTKIYKYYIATNDWLVASVTEWKDITWFISQNTYFINLINNYIYFSFLWLDWIWYISLYILDWETLNLVYNSKVWISNLSANKTIKANSGDLLMYYSDNTWEWLARVFTPEDFTKFIWILKSSGSTNDYKTVKLLWWIMDWYSWLIPWSELLIWTVISSTEILLHR